MLQISVCNCIIQMEGDYLKGELCLNVECFNLKYTLECGQCFRWQKINENTYIGVIKDRVLKVEQEGSKLYVSSNKNENLKEVVEKYFDLEEDYALIEKIIVKIDENIANAVKNTSGIRHLNQNFFETLISYIISANNNISRISKSVNEIAKRYGRRVIFEDEEYYLFPTKEELKNVSIKDYRECGVGFRDKYVYKAVQDMLDEKLDERDIKSMSTEELRKELISFDGVGPKVADCILLFSCSRKEVFPIDVWVERVMSLLYFKMNNGKVKKKDILEYAKTNFKEYAGIIQQHLFYNMRENLM